MPDHSVAKILSVSIIPRSISHVAEQQLTYSTTVSSFVARRRRSFATAAHDDGHGKKPAGAEKAIPMIDPIEYYEY
jgi:hypothetical protein